ncbi:MAG TPA: XrtA/PEP-CTERM system histidine kinase PrsK [Povalibacter sp.]
MPGLSVLSYATACVAFAALAILVFVSDRGIRQGRALFIAAVVSAIWAGLLTLLEAGRAVPDWVVVAADLIRAAAWLRFLLLLAPPKWPRAVQWLPVLFVAWALFGRLIFDLDQVLTRGGLLAALLGLVVLEQIYRNASVDVRGDLKFLMIGLGGMFAFDLFIFSQAELFRGFDAESWHARGIVNALLVPFLIVGARRLPDVRFELFVSRNVTLYTTAIVAVGVYVLVTAGVGLLIRQVGGEWGEAVRLVFLVGAIVVLVTLVASGATRRQLRVFLSKHFYRTKYDYRLEWLRFIRTLSTASVTDAPVAAVRSVAQILDAPGGVLYRQPDGGAAFVATATWPERIEVAADAQPIHATSPLIEFMRARRWIVDLRERERRPDLYDNAEVPEWLAADPRWRLVSPIFFGDALLGFFLLLEPPAPFRLMYEDRDLLNTAGQHVATLLAQQDADRRVAELSQFEAYNRLTTFVMHDLKNSAAQLSLLVGNAVRHKHNPEFIDDAISTIAQTAERMTRLIGQLRRGTLEAQVRPTDLHEALQVALDRCAARRPQPVLESGPDHACVIAADPERLAAALEHVIRNAQEASGEEGDVRISVEEGAGRIRVCVQDAGVGMDDDFIRTRLFRPFDTTKSPSGMGIGAYQAREFARSIGGDVEVRSAPGRGTRFAFDFPLAS